MRLLFAVLITAALTGCGSNDCLRMSKAANSAAEAVSAAPKLDLGVSWVDVGEPQREAADKRKKMFRQAAAKASFSGVIAGPVAELARSLADAYRGVAVGYEGWTDAVESVGGKKDKAVSKARAALALVQGYNAVCLSERPADLPEPPPVPYGVPQKENFIPCTKIDTTAVEGAMKSGKGLEASLDALDKELSSVPSAVDEPKNYTQEPIDALQARHGKAQEALTAVQEAKAAAAKVEATAKALDKSAAQVQKSLDETKRLQDEVQSSCGL